MKLYDAPGINTMVVRQFILERGGIDLEVEPVDILTMENRKPAYVNNVNSRGGLPALRISDDFVLTEITAVCEYLDEIAQGGASLIGDSALERAETRMWLRRMDLEIAQPIIEWYRNDPDSIAFYRGHRTPCPEARLAGKVATSQALNRLDAELEGKQYLCGDRFSVADIHFYGLVRIMFEPVPWATDAARKNVAAYFARMDARPKSKIAMQAFEKGNVSIKPF